MRLRVNPLTFVVRLVVLLIGTYLVWGWVSPAYLQVLATLTRAGVWLTEWSSDPAWRFGTSILTQGSGIFFYHPAFATLHPPLAPQGIPGDWIMANVVLLLALMLATPAPSWRARFFRLAVAVAAVLVLQVADIVVAVKVEYSRLFPGVWGPVAGSVYQFLDAFFQSFDTQLFPFIIWGGIHFRELLPQRVVEAPDAEPAPARRTTKARRRRERRERERRVRAGKG